MVPGRVSRAVRFDRGISVLCDLVHLPVHKIPRDQSAVGGIVLSVAAAKAFFVMTRFMHLKFEGRWKYLLLSPTVILAMGLPLALLPDIGVHYYTTDYAQATAHISQEAPGVSEKTAAEHPREVTP